MEGITMKKLNWKSIVGWTIAALVAGFIVYSNIQKQKTSNEKPNILFMEYQTGLGTASDAMKKIIAAFKENNPNLSFNWIAVDTGYNPSTAVSILQQQLALHKIDAVVSFGFLINSVVLPITQKENIPTIALYNAGMEKFDEYKNYQSFSHSQEDSIKPIVDFINKNVRKVAVLYINDVYGPVALNYIQKNYKGGEIVFKESFEPKDLDTRILVYKALQENPEAILVLGYGAGYNNILRMLKSNEYKGYIIADLTTGSSYQEYVQNPEVYRDVYFSAPKINTESASYRKLMTTKNHNEFLPINMVLYDAFDYIQKAVDNGKGLTQNDFLKQGENQGIVETVFLPNGRSQVKMVLSKWNDSKIVPVEE